MTTFYKAVWGVSDYSEEPDGVARARDRLARAGFSADIAVEECQKRRVCTSSILKSPFVLKQNGRKFFGNDNGVQKIKE